MVGLGVEVGDGVGLDIGDIEGLGSEAVGVSESESELIQGLLGEIDEREASILRMRFGLDDGEAMTLKEIGATIGLTRERVRQIETEALRKLNELINK